MLIVLSPLCVVDQNPGNHQFDPTNSSAWIQYAKLETLLGDYTRTRAIYELAAAQSPLSMPENLWKAYIDFEYEQGERERTRALYERLVALSGHVKVWISFAEFEASSIPLSQAMREEEDEDEDEDDEKMVEGDMALARGVFDRAYKDMKSKELKEEVRAHISTSCGCLLTASGCSVSYYSKHGRHSKRSAVRRRTWRRCRL